MKVGYAEIAILGQHLASYAVNHSSGKCNTLSYDGLRLFYNTIFAGKRRSLLMETMMKCMTRSLNVTPKTH